MADRARKISPDAVLLRRIKDTLGLTDQQVGDELLSCKRELASAYLHGRAWLRLDPGERDHLAAYVAGKGRALKLIELEL